MRSALPESGSNHDTGLAAVVSEMLGFTNRNHIKVIWGDSDRNSIEHRMVQAEQSPHKAPRFSVLRTNFERTCCNVQLPC